MKCTLKHKKIDEFRKDISNLKDIDCLENGRDWLYSAVKDQNAEGVKVLLERINQDNQINSQERQINALDKRKKFPNLIDPTSGYTPLGKAIEDGNAEIVNLLIANPYIHVDDVGRGKSAFLLAMHKQKAPVLSALFDKIYKDDPDKSVQALFQQDKKGKSAFKYICRQNNIEIFKHIFNTTTSSQNQRPDNFTQFCKELTNLENQKKVSPSVAPLLYQIIGKRLGEVSLLLDNNGNPASSDSKSVALPLQTRESVEGDNKTLSSGDNDDSLPDPPLWKHPKSLLTANGGLPLSSQDE